MIPNECPERWTMHDILNAAGRCKKCPMGIDGQEMQGKCADMQAGSSGCHEEPRDKTPQEMGFAILDFNVPFDVPGPDPRASTGLGGSERLDGPVR